MEYDINRWLEFVHQVEKNLPRLESTEISQEYKNNISDLMGQIRDEAQSTGDLIEQERQAAYLRINRLGSKLKSVAYFMG